MKRGGHSHRGLLRTRQALEAERVGVWSLGQLSAAVEVSGGSHCENDKCGKRMCLVKMVLRVLSLAMPKSDAKLFAMQS